MPYFRSLSKGEPTMREDMKEPALHARRLGLIRTCTPCTLRSDSGWSFDANPSLI
jgi:hypothetical protein